MVEDYGSELPSVTATPVTLDQIPNIDLPEPRARLDLPTPTPTPTAPLLDLDELRAQASATHRTYAVIELDAAGQNLTEFPVRNLGTIGSLFQESADALAQEEAGNPLFAARSRHPLQRMCR